MTNRATIASLLVLTAAFLLLAPSRKAEAQCAPGSWFCAQIRIGGGWRPPPPRRAQVLVVQPAPPPVLYVQPAPPPVVYVQPAPPPPPPPPQPPVVIVQQQDPPQAEAYYVGQAQPQPTVVASQPVIAGSGIGLHGSIGFMGTSNVHIGGVSGALRLRQPEGHFAIDLGIGAYGGIDYNGASRTEVPLTADGLFFFNPRSRWQVYALLGIGASWAHAQNSDVAFTTIGSSRDYSYLGGETGIGLEWRLGDSFALDGDVRAFIRQRVDGDPRPEFVEPGTGRQTDTSGGLLTTLGATFYL